MVPRKGLASAVLALALAAGPGTAAADHVGISADVSATVTEIRDRSVMVEVSWNVVCTGARGTSSFSGHLNLVDQGSGESIYLGGVTSPFGTARQLVERFDHERHLAPRLKISCWEDASVHGDQTEATGPAFAVPGRRRAGSGGSGSGGGGSDDPAAGSAPAPPPGLPAGACAVERRGTSADDELVGTAGHDRLFGQAGADRIRGRGGHDCLFGGAGRDRLHGGAGRDALVGGRGDDVLVAVDGVRDLVRCGPGRERATVDRRDRVRGCERVRRSG